MNLIIYQTVGFYNVIFYKGENEIEFCFDIWGGSALKVMVKANNSFDGAERRYQNIVGDERLKLFYHSKDEDV